jgi:serine/threonine protein kinase
LTEEQAKPYFVQLFSALSHVHEKGISHRDLKPENILLDETKSKIKIADFGLCTPISDGIPLVTSCGTPNYASPDII